MNVFEAKIPDIKIIEPKRFGDNRGCFFESYNEERYFQNGILVRFVQDNCSKSCIGTIRGLHYQLAHPQAKLVQVIKGEVFDVVVDIRLGSPTFGQWVGEFLSEENGRQLYIPEGFAHGFCVTADKTIFYYKCSDYYHPEDEGGILWSDLNIGIEWPDLVPVLSDKDLRYDCLNNIPCEMLPRYK